MGLPPTQLGESTLGGAEAAMGAAFCSQKDEEGRVWLELNFSNAFNIVH